MKAFGPPSRRHDLAKLMAPSAVEASNSHRRAMTPREVRDLDKALELADRIIAAGWLPPPPRPKG